MSHNQPSFEARIKQSNDRQGNHVMGRSEVANENSLNRDNGKDLTHKLPLKEA